MTKLLQNKSLIKFLGIALSILLVVALIPQIGIAYGSKDDVVDEAALAETGENAATEGEEVATDGEEAATSEEGDEPAEGEDAVEGEVSVVDGVEMVSHKVEIPGEEDEDTTENAIAPQSSEDEGIDTAANQEPIKKSEALVGNSDREIKAGEEITNTSSPLTFSGNKTYTLTVNGTLKSDILITGGAKVTINGTGTIEGTRNGSVIVVEGASALQTKLVFDGPTVTKGTGSNGTYLANFGKCGGGILVCRKDVKWPNKDSNNTPSLHFVSGKVEDNEADTGGGIFIDYGCGFTMSDGTVRKNTANNHEGGGICFYGSWNHDYSQNKGMILGGLIEENETKTEYDWGGGGVFVVAGSTLYIESALITENTAQGYGGGIAGCPHAQIGIGALEDGAAVFQNKGWGVNQPTNPSLRFLTNESARPETSGMDVGCGDFLAFGLGVSQGAAAQGDYAKGKFDGRADDFYCTLASYISGTDLGSHKDGIAWIGYEAGVPADKGIETGNMEPNGDVSIRVGESYASRDASLGLKSTATSDESGVKRTVTIRGNKSNTHGGGVGCNGTLEFGTLPEAETETIKGYDLELTKKLVNSLDSTRRLSSKKGSFPLP